MADMHPSMRRLYAAVAALDPGQTRQVDVANAINESSQRVNNWEARGISKEGAISAQRTLGISATHLLDGTDPVWIGQSQPARITPAIMAAAWRLAGMVAEQTTGSARLEMPRDAELVAQSVNAAIEDAGGYGGQRTREIGGNRQPSGKPDAGKEIQPKSRGASERSPRSPKRAKAGVA